MIIAHSDRRLLSLVTAAAASHGPGSAGTSYMHDKLSGRDRVPSTDTPRCTAHAAGLVALNVQERVAALQVDKIFAESDLDRSGEFWSGC